MTKRLFVDAPLAVDLDLTLDPDRSHYLCRVLRQRRGDRVLLLRGDGDAYDARLVDADPRGCAVRVEALAAREPPPLFRLHLAQALIKGERLDFVLQKATELGVTDVWLIETERTEVRIEGQRVNRRETHWRRILESAVEQCGRLHVPVLHGPLMLPSLLETQAVTQAFLLDPGASALDAAPALVETMLLVGPEGGFSDVERAAILARGARAMGLGRWILRADTAPVAALAVLRQSWGWRAP